ncbi:hemolysin-type calcium-binding protein [Klebsiella phage UPM 2146]|uniref:Hemolysin-type calcium-binding protein n=1 Tax=Klebsiella phage UPM 2146 TaxID=2847816 RepID=A0A5Q2F2Q0_9CAUD|nr:tail protein [Klebsiella phage UPM 2146]QGF20652.1 hemolysin-type calcium-binding protein [Klebsiella phage UPM 2146]
MANKPTKPNFPLGLESQDQSVFQEGILNNGVVEHGPDAVMTVPETPDASGVPSAVRYNEDDDQFEGYYNEGGWLPLGGGNGGRWEALPHASSSLLQAGRAYLVDNTDGVSTVLFPSPKRIGDSVTVCDLYGKFSTYPLTVDGNGKSIYGSADSMTISTDNVSATFTWTGEARGWVITSGVGLGQGRVYSREIYSQILSATTPSITLSTQPSIVDVYVDGKRLKESLYTLDGYEVKFDPALASGSDVQIIQYIPIQLGAGGGGSGGTVITWEYNGGSAIGGETQIVLDVVVDSVSEIYIRGSRQQIGRGFTFDPATSTITLADELDAGDDVVVVINGDPTVYNQIDRTPWEVARAFNVSNNSVIMSNDRNTTLDGKTIVYDINSQNSWEIPAGIPVGSKISSVSSGILVYTPGNVSVTLTLLTTGTTVLKRLANSNSGNGGDMVLYKASSNAVERAISMALKDFVNLHDYYLSSDNGDWYPAFNRAFQDSQNILVPYGSHVVKTTVVPPSNSKIIGLGEASIVKSPDAIDAAATNLVTVFRATGSDNILISDITIDGGVNEVNTAKSFTRTVRFINCTNVSLLRVRVLNNADWSTSFEGGHDFTVKNYYQRSYRYQNTAINLNGGRDGLHFMDCYNVNADGLDIESGDDCVGITTTGTDLENITIRNLWGSSNIASLVIFNEEKDSNDVYYSANVTGLNISGIRIKKGGNARNIVRVIGYGANTQIKDVSILDVRGKAFNSYGIWVQGSVDHPVDTVHISNSDVGSQKAHGVLLQNIKRLSGNVYGYYEGVNSSASFVGVNMVSITGAMFTPGSRSSYGYGVQVLTSKDIVLTPDIESCGAGLFSSASGGNLRIVNCDGVTIPYGRAVGDVAVSYWGINFGGNTNLDVGLEFVFGGFTNSSLPNSYYLKAPAVDIKWKEASDGTVTMSIARGASIVRNSQGNFTITFNNDMRSTLFSWQATAYHNGALRLVRLASAVGTKTMTIQVTDTANAATFADFIELKAFNTATGS